MGPILKGEPVTGQSNARRWISLAVAGMSGSSTVQFPLAALPLGSHDFYKVVANYRMCQPLGVYDNDGQVITDPSKFELPPSLDPSKAEQCRCWISKSRAILVKLNEKWPKINRSSFSLEDQRIMMLFYLKGQQKLLDIKRARKTTNAPSLKRPKTSDAATQTDGLSAPAAKKKGKPSKRALDKMRQLGRCTLNGLLNEPSNTLSEGPGHIKHRQALAILRQLEFPFDTRQPDEEQLKAGQLWLEGELLESTMPSDTPELQAARALCSLE